MTIDYHSGKFLLISFKVSLHEFILGFSHCVCGRRCTPMFHTEDRAAGKDKSLTFSRGPKGCQVMFFHLIYNWQGWQGPLSRAPYRNV